MIRIALAVAVLLAFPVHARPVVAILADPRGTETTDLIAPYSVLAESGAVEVKIISPNAEPVRIMPGVAWIRPHQTLAGFDAAHPEGPDMVIVPFMMPARDAERAAWLRRQADRGARIVAICGGAETLADAGLLDGRSATTHWYVLAGLERRYPQVRWRRDARWVTEGRITTTAGVSASIPAALAMLEELAGAETMHATAARLRVPPPVRTHDGAAFRIDGEAVALGAGNALNFWRREKIGLNLADGFDELAFGSALDGWSRTYRSEAWAYAPGGATSKRGLTVYGPQRAPRFSRTPELGEGEPMQTMLDQISGAYGKGAARFVALNIEHPYWLERR